MAYILYLYPLSKQMLIAPRDYTFYFVSAFKTDVDWSVDIHIEITVHSFSICIGQMAIISSVWLLFQHYITLRYFT